MGQHSRPASTKRRAILLTVLGLVLVVGVAAGVQAAIRGLDDGPSTPSTTGPDDRAPRAGSGPRTQVDTSTPAREGSGGGFPGQPKKRSGLRPESGLASGLGKDAGDLAAKAQDLIDAENQQPLPLGFRVSSYNVLGAGHTGPRGNKPQYAGYEQRMGSQVQMLRSQDVDVVGFQEFEAPQFRSFMRRTGGAWGVYPAMSKGRAGVRNSIAWRRDVWDLADYTTVPTPYFRGNPVPMAVILLTHKESKRQLYVINVHNPASNSRRGDNERWRDVATDRQVAKVRSLRKQAPQVPVILMGDFNERQEAYCRVTGGGDMVAANPGGDRPGCSPPALMGIDWIFGTTDLAFSDYRRLSTGGASDHPMLVATARAD